MERRDFLKLGAALPALAVVPALAAPAERPVTWVEFPSSIPWFYTEILDGKSMNAAWAERIGQVNK